MTGPYSYFSYTWYIKPAGAILSTKYTISGKSVNNYNGTLCQGLFVFHLLLVMRSLPAKKQVIQFQKPIFSLFFQIATSTNCPCGLPGKQNLKQIDSCKGLTRVRERSWCCLKGELNQLYIGWLFRVAMSWEKVDQVYTAYIGQSLTMKQST